MLRTSRIPRGPWSQLYGTAHQSRSAAKAERTFTCEGAKNSSPKTDSPAEDLPEEGAQRPPGPSSVPPRVHRRSWPDGNWFWREAPRADRERRGHCDADHARPVHEHETKRAEQVDPEASPHPVPIITPLSSSSYHHRTHVSRRTPLYQPATIIAPRSSLEISVPTKRQKGFTMRRSRKHNRR